MNSTTYEFILHNVYYTTSLEDRGEGGFRSYRYAINLSASGVRQIFLKTRSYALKTRFFKESRKREHQDRDAPRQVPETGRCNRPSESRALPSGEEEVPS